MFGKYMVAHLLGHTRDNEVNFRRVERKLTKQGFICFVPAIYVLSEYLKYQDLIDDMCYEKLLVCDLCVAVTLGESTNIRISQAKKLNIPSFTFNIHMNRLIPYDDMAKKSDVYVKYLESLNK